MEHGHSVYLVLALMAIALMAGFTGLSLTQGASALGIGRRNLVLSMSAVALWSGIWSLHFVAMLGMTLPVPFHYDALVTMMSALVAILLTGAALLLVHFGDQTPQRIMIAGLCVGIGILAMHYLGMSGVRDVKPVYSAAGIAVAIAASLVLCVASFWISYGNRERCNILVGTVVFAVTVVAVHFIAMASTHFVEIEGAPSSGLWLSNEVLAFGVTFSSFVISGAFLLVGVTFAAGQGKPMGDDTDQQPDPKAALPDPPEIKNQISGRLFCPWSISQMETRLAGTSFIKCHRSYLINADHVTRFKRKKDNGVGFLDGAAHLDKAPVSRSYINHVSDTLGA